MDLDNIAGLLTGSPVEETNEPVDVSEETQEVIEEEELVDDSEEESTEEVKEEITEDKSEEEQTTIKNVIYEDPLRGDYHIFFNNKFACAEIPVVSMFLR